MRFAKGIVLALWLNLWLGSALAEGLAIGQLVIHSAPGEPLQASVPIGLPGELPLAALRVSAADAEAYGLEEMARPSMLDDMRIALLARGEGRARVQLFGSEPWQGEALTLLLRFDAPEQSLIAQFEIHAIEADDEPQYIRVGEHETLDSVALRLADRHSRSYLHMMYALYRLNPKAFYRDNMNNLRGGSRLQIPNTQQLHAFGDAEAFAAIKEHQQRWEQARLGQQQGTAEQQARLDLERDKQELLAELQQLSTEEAEYAEQNALMRAQLAALEGRVSQFTNQLLDEPEPPQAKAEQEPPDNPAPLGPLASAAEDLPPNTAPTAETRIPAWLFLLLLTLAIAVVVFMQRQLQGRSST